jgi:pSer/pThr/pTyr-binding forkhead associated (FHA) protein
VPWGPHRGTRAVLTPGKVLRIGRHGDDIELAKDTRVSRAHLEVEWDGERCLVRDRGSATGTQINGAKIDEAEAHNGDWIRAGDTLISVHFEGHTKRLPRPKMAGRPGNVITRARKKSVLEALAAEDGHLYAILDSTRTPRIIELLRESVEYSRSLYEGDEGDALWEAAPYLVELPDKRSRLVKALVTEGLVRRWGIFVVSSRRFKDVRRHFRRFLMVQDEVGERMYFRFYDPVVLRAFLPTCTAVQSAEFFQEIDALLAEGDRGELLRFTPGAREPKVVG